MHHVPIIDAHLDLATNQTYFDRDLTLPLDDLNRLEAQMSDFPFRGRASVTLPEMRKARVGVCLATLLARSGPRHMRPQQVLRGDLDHPHPDGAQCACFAQLAYYRLLARRGEIRLLDSREDLVEHWRGWLNGNTEQIGVIVSMEGADPISDADELRLWWDHGVRALGLVHYGFGRYGAGTGVDGPLTDLGRKLLERMQEFGVVLDVTHLSDRSMEEALDVFGGPVWASHHNCRALVPWERQLTDDQIRRLAARDAVIGVAMDAIMLYPGWVRGQTSPEVVDLTAAADQVDHLCQTAGDVKHVGLGSDLDGTFGTEQTPRDLKSIADLQKLAGLLSDRGYGDGDVDAVFHGNWLRKLEETLPSRLVDPR